MAYPTPQDDERDVLNLFSTRCRELNKHLSGDEIAALVHWMRTGHVLGGMTYRDSTLLCELGAWALARVANPARHLRALADEAALRLPETPRWDDPDGAAQVLRRVADAL